MLSVGRVMEQSAVTYQTAPKSAEQISEKKTTTLASDATDKFIRSGATFTPAYTKATVTDNKSNMARSGTDPDSNIPPEKLEEEQKKQQLEEKTKVTEEKTDAPKYTNAAEARTEMMKDMVMQTIAGQVEEYRKTGTMKELEEILSSFSDEEENPETYWSPRETASRILQFAIELAANDPSSVRPLKEATDEAFIESENHFGGKGALPPVSYKTYEKVQIGFFEWAKHLSQRR